MDTLEELDRQLQPAIHLAAEHDISLNIFATQQHGENGDPRVDVAYWSQYEAASLSPLQGILSLLTNDVEDVNELRHTAVWSARGNDVAEEVFRTSLGLHLGRCLDYLGDETSPFGSAFLIFMLQEKSKSLQWDNDTITLLDLGHIKVKAHIRGLMGQGYDTELQIWHDDDYCVTPYAFRHPTKEEAREVVLYLLVQFAYLLLQPLFK